MRFRPGARHGPRRVADVLDQVRDRNEPLTLLARVQRAWPQVAGVGVIAQAEPVAERDGVVTVACHTATWAQELDLLHPELLGRLNDLLREPGSGAGDAPLRGLRFTADASRHLRT